MGADRYIFMVKICIELYAWPTSVYTSKEYTKPRLSNVINFKVLTIYLKHVILLNSYRKWHNGNIYTSYIHIHIPSYVCTLFQ